MGIKGIRERTRTAARELEKVVAEVSETDARLRPIPDKWTIAEVVDHIAQTQIRGAEELRHLLAGRRPPGPPVYEALRSGAAAWVPWRELIEGLCSANNELLALLDSVEDATLFDGPTARSILVVNPSQPDGGAKPEIFATELGLLEYALVQRLHLLEHRNQIKRLMEALAG